MTEPTRYDVGFASTDDPQLDHETTLLEDRLLTLDEIVEACRKYRVRARVGLRGELVATIVPALERPSSARLGNPETKKAADPR